VLRKKMNDSRSFFYFLYEEGENIIRSGVYADYDTVKKKHIRYQALYPHIKLKMARIEQLYFESTLTKRHMTFDLLQDQQQLEWPRILAEAVSVRRCEVREYMNKNGYNEAKFLFSDNPVGVLARVRVRDFLDSIERKVVKGPVEWLDGVISRAINWFKG